MIFMPLTAEESINSRFPAVLSEGTYPVEGISGFLPNRIPSLYGKYRTHDGGLVEVFGSTEPVVFSADLWKKGKIGNLSIQEGQTVSSDNGKKRLVIAIEHRITMRNTLSDRSLWRFFFVFDTSDTDTFKLSFINTFLDRTSFYFSAARYLGDLSFPSKL